MKANPIIGLACNHIFLPSNLKLLERHLASPNKKSGMNVCPLSAFPSPPNIITSSPKNIVEKKFDDAKQLDDAFCNSHPIQIDNDRMEPSQPGAETFKIIRRT
jgi:hypothetical protein